VNQVAPAIAVEVDRVFEIGRRQELGLAEIAGPVAEHLGRPKVAALDDAKRIRQLRLEHLGAAAIECQRCDRADHLFLAEVDAEVGLEAPDRNDDRARHAELRFDLAQRRAQRLHVTQALGHAFTVDHAAGEFLEGLLEHALALVGGEHRWIERDPVERAQAALRHALGGGVSLELRDEGIEAARCIAGGAERRCAEHGRQKRGGEKGCHESHCRPRITRNFVTTRCNGMPDERVARSKSEVKTCG
jgi:hypothetical protein